MSILHKIGLETACFPISSTAFEAQELSQISQARHSPVMLCFYKMYYLFFKTGRTSSLILDQLIMLVGIEFTVLGNADVFTEDMFTR
jgi:hypothetical protein